MIEQVGEFWRSQTTRLALVYLAIIMAMSISFSLSIYRISAEQLEQQLPGSAWSDERGAIEPSARTGMYLAASVQEAKKQLGLRLYILNLVMVVLGAAFSVLMARWTLEPIERNIGAQARFVSDASHELRTPLTSIQTANEVALRRKKLTLAEARQTLRDNLDDVQRLQRLSTMLLQVAADDMPLQREPLSVAQLAHRVIRATDTDARANSVTVTHTIDPQLLVEADEAAATQALTILVDNAIKYSPPDEAIAISAIQRRANIVIRVTDHGPGIAKADQRRVFERFYRTDQARQRSGATSGYGLGLEIARKIARHHGGDIELRSALGRGSTFSLVLPAAKA